MTRARQIMLVLGVGALGLSLGMMASGSTPALLGLLVFGAVGVPVWREGWRWYVHNVVAHPLLAIVPPLGEWLHQRTAPADEDEDPVAPDQTDWTHRP